LPSNPPGDQARDAAADRQQMTAMKSLADAVRVVIVDDDELFRETLGLSLSDEGYEVVSFAGGSATLEHFAAGGRADAVLLDWRMPEMNGLELLRRLRRAGNRTPVIFLTALSEDIYEEAALEGGAVDFIDKSRSLSILLKRLRLIAARDRKAPEAGRSQPDGVLQLGRLELRLDVNRASWAGMPIELTPTEFKIVALLAQRAGEDVSYREIYDLVRGKNFAAGYGSEGYRANVRTCLKRIRKKFYSVDPAFEQIVNYPGFGYRYDWTEGSRPMRNGGTR
jgi:two-component system, OmpR family, response regulator ChvI